MGLSVAYHFVCANAAHVLRVRFVWVTQRAVWSGKNAWLCNDKKGNLRTRHDLPFARISEHLALGHVRCHRKVLESSAKSSLATLGLDDIFQFLSEHFFVLEMDFAALFHGLLSHSAKQDCNTKMKARKEQRHEALTDLDVFYSPITILVG